VLRSAGHEHAHVGEQIEWGERDLMRQPRPPRHEPQQGGHDDARGDDAVDPYARRRFEIVSRETTFCGQSAQCTGVLEV
jgi:hypothetical protein